MTPPAELSPAVRADQERAGTFWRLTTAWRSSSIAPQTAISLYRQLLALNPNDANVHLHLGLVLRQVGQTAAADAEIATAVRLDPALASRVPSRTGG